MKKRIAALLLSGFMAAGEALDNDIPWYGPLYLAQYFGNSAGT